MIQFSCSFFPPGQVVCPSLPRSEESSLNNPASQSKPTAAAAVMSFSEQPQTAIALIGNPGTGKSTILNGLVGAPVFKSGMSFGTGRTSRLQEHKHGGILYFDTPGLNDIDKRKRKEAGEAIDELLRQDVSMKVVFVVFALNGRIMPEDATTIRLVLDAITSVDTNDRFGVIINQAPAAWIDALKASPLRERRVRSSYTGERYTSHWCYVEHDDEVDSAEARMLMTPELRDFFNRVPETRPVGAIVEAIDTDTFEEKLERERILFEEKGEILRKELCAQGERVKALESLAEELIRTLSEDRDSNSERRKKKDERQKELEEKIREQAEQIVAANEGAKDLKMDMDTMKQRGEENEQRAREELEDIREQFELERERTATQTEEYIRNMDPIQRRELMVSTLKLFSSVAVPLLQLGFAFSYM